MHSHLRLLYVPPFLRSQAPSHAPHSTLTGQDQSTASPWESTSQVSIALHELKKTRLRYCA